MPKYRFFAVCPRHTEALLAAELESLGVPSGKQFAGGIAFDAETVDAMRVMLNSRIASKVLLKITSVICENETRLYETTCRIAWEKYFSVDKTIRVDLSAHRSPFESLDFALLRVKDGICDRFRRVTGMRPDVEKTAPDVRIHVFLDGTTATFYFNVSGDSLFKRGWRQEKGEAPLKENLAASLIAMTEWDATSPLMDLFCGSGTIAIEAAQKAISMAPGLARHFAFENLTLFDADLFSEMKEDAKAKIRFDAPIRIHASDISTIVVDKARANAFRAGLGPLMENGRLTFEAKDARAATPVAPSGIIISNPPYGEQSNPKSASVASMMKDVADNLKHAFAGWDVYLLTSDRKLPREMRLAESRKIEIYNGPLECRFFKFTMVAGSNRKA